MNDRKTPRPVPHPSFYSRPFWDGAREKKLGWKSQPTAMVHLDGCRVPADLCRQTDDRRNFDRADQY